MLDIRSQKSEVSRIRIAATLRLCGVILLFSVAIQAQWVNQTVDTTASFRGLSVVNEKVIWASGTGGTVIRTIDGGKKWNVIQVPDAAKLDFRDIEAFDANTAYILSIGNGESSRIYKTINGGKTWNLQFKNTNEKAFFDAIACWDRKNCIAMSDPVDGHYLLIFTSDSGRTWKRIVSNAMPAAKDGEAAFAASGTCLITFGSMNAYIVSGGMDARMFSSKDKGRSWAAVNTPLVKGTPGSGIFSIAFRDPLRGVMVGGNYEKPDEKNINLAFTGDGGTIWYKGEGLGGYRSSVAYIGTKWIIAVGPTGSDISYDNGAKWTSLGKISMNSVGAKGKDAIWAVGEKGTVSKYIERDERELELFR